MAYSVSLWFGEGAEARIRRIWQELTDAGVETFAGGPIRPHVTLAHALELEVDPFVAALEGRLESYPAFDITFPGLGLFVDSGILYLSVVMTGVLWTLHRDVFRLASVHGGRSSPYYRPDRWTPHCTLAVSLTREKMLEAVNVCQQVPFPLTLSAIRVGIIENPSEKELSALPLPVLE